MSVPLYMDVHIHSAVTATLWQRGVDVVTAQEDNGDSLSDPDLLDRATSFGRVLVSEDEDLLVEAGRRQQSGESFAGLARAPQGLMTVGKLISDLELIAKVYDPQDMLNRVEYLPF